MKKILFFAANMLTCIGVATGAVRDGTTVSRTKTEKETQQTQVRTATTSRKTTAPRKTTLSPRSATTTPRTTTSRNTTQNPRTNTSSTKKQTVKARATNDDSFSMSNTRTGAEYEKCKNTYFSCMDQFCKLKNDDYRRCSCNNRVFDLIDKRKTLSNAGEQLTEFTENLEVVGMTAAQAAAMRTESEGESALTNDKSASKALLQAIMNSIRGEDSNVGGKYSDLNSVTISFDTTNAFGMSDTGQAIAAYNGDALYSAIYPQCRNAVRNDCNNASLQRAVTAYLMAIEQDCNTVQTAIEKTQKQMKSAVREGSAMLDLARVENRQKHNSADITTCINNVEAAILSEQVCGANYHKCLDNGQYIDISTGKPIIGVKDFYKLEKLLTFSDGIDAADQKLSQNPSNRIFVQNFESRTKKFAADALDKCVEDADFVWSEYLNKAMLDIYYAQRNKVSEIKQGCFEHISECYTNTDTAINAAMSSISDDNKITLQPGKIALNSKICNDYIESCNGMFDNNIIQEYVEHIKDTDLKTACRAVATQCFSKYGGTNYENFYYPHSGLFDKGSALDWFTLYEYNPDTGNTKKSEYISPCAEQLSKIAACHDEELIKEIFGGFDKTTIEEETETGTITTTYYGQYDTGETNYNYINQSAMRSAGVATEVYNQIISILTTQCDNLQGRFIEKHWIGNNDYKSTNVCISRFTYEFANNIVSQYNDIAEDYIIGKEENMCPYGYADGVDTQSWGACLCWENGRRRSKNGKSTSCVAVLPTNYAANDSACKNNGTEWFQQTENDPKLPTSTTDWCTQKLSDHDTPVVCSKESKNGICQTPGIVGTE